MVTLTFGAYSHAKQPPDPFKIGDLLKEMGEFEIGKLESGN